ncbi:AraC family transcriptional regulator [Corallococcus sp. M34]|uniref:helix-turn-helix domain-containing protein n=1 Tax=Citreicoccus inhibens TaxID=2849499 RepID=UPI001C222E52|nr:AraC family transcriptional regulator [Citreicoccus inhibens]MBU8899678.1 AraC family transcriptional regulator [Citreicoccus inhibens]
MGRARVTCAEGAAGSLRTWRPALLPGVEVTRVEEDVRLWAGHSTRYALLATDAGAFDFWYRKRVWTQGPGRLKLKQPGEVHRDLRVHAPVTALSLAFEPSLVENAARAVGLRAPLAFRDVLTRGTGHTEAAWGRLRAVLSDSGVGPLEAESALAETVEAMLREYAEEAPLETGDARHLPAVRRARDFLHARVAEAVGLEALSSAVGLNRFQLLRQFRAEFGLPPHEYLTHLRVARARVLLARGRPAGDVALEVGLYDQSQLNRHFKRIVGLTPGQYARARQ